VTAWNFAGQRALVTGGTRGIGAVIAAQLAAAGAHVFVNYARDDAGAQRAAAEIEQHGGLVTIAKANLVDPNDIKAMFDLIAASGPLDILVHSAAIGSFKPSLSVRANQWDLTMAVNAKALLLCAQQAAPLMEQRRGRIVAISSLGGTRVIPSYGAIGVAKAAMESLVRYLAIELAPRGIGVNAVAGGLVDTASIRLHPLHRQLEQEALARTPAGRIASPADIARVVLFLCSRDSEWIVGQTIVADGGASLS
jgi:enoyl-[acyl-carrier protein] reductase III